MTMPAKRAPAKTMPAIGKLCAIIFAVAVGLGLGGSEAATVLQVGTLIDGNGGEPIKDAVIVIDGERIQAVGKNGTVKVPAGAQIIQLKDKTVIPGLIDTHAHYRAWQAELYVGNGITTAYDIGDQPLAWSLVQRDAIAHGKIVGPRLLLGGRLNGPGPSDEGEGGSRGRTLNTAVKTPEEARQRTRELLAMHVDAIKALEHLTVEQLKAITEEAHQAGKIVITHSVNGIDAVLAGVPVDDIEHFHTVTMGTIGDDERKKLDKARTSASNRMTSQEVLSFMDEQYYDRTIQAMLAHHTSWSPTMAQAWRAFSPSRATFEAEDHKLLDNPALRYIPPYFRQNIENYYAGTAKLAPELDSRVRKGYANLKPFIHRFAEAGGKLQTGSDPDAGMPGYGVHQEMALFVEAGLTPMQALMAATRNPAERQGRLKDFGVIAPGTFADLVVLDANPLDNILNTQRIAMIFQQGRLLKKPYFHANYHNPIPRPQPDRQAPEIDDVQPASLVEGDDAATLTITGRNFLGTDIVKLNGKPVPATVKARATKFPQNYQRSREMTVNLPAGFKRAPGTYTITVEHPGEGGVVSTPAYVVVGFK